MNKSDIFGGLGLTDDPVTHYAKRIFNCSVVGANEFRRLKEENLPRDTWLSIVFELMFFYVALTDVDVLKRIDDHKRKKVIVQLADVLVSNVVDYVFEDTMQDGNRALKQKYMDVAEARIEEYSLYDRIMPRTESDEPQGSALFAVCAKISALAGDATNPNFLTTCHSHVYDSLLVLGTAPFVAAIS